ncbi:MAG: biotin synthase BioB [Spirochaetes bacterium]|nr:biotin synthase BioB [Spirochaetota bacterium]
MIKSNIVNELEQKVISGGKLSVEEAISLVSESYDSLSSSADNIRRHFSGNEMVLCSIINAKSGKCPEDCRYCAQSSYYNTNISEYPLISYSEILSQALKMRSFGVNRFSIVTSGRALSNDEFNSVCEIISYLVKDTGMTICASLGFMTEERAIRLKHSGLSLYHHNLETNNSYFSKICTTHSHREKIDTIKNIRSAGIDLCIGGIIGLGESWEDRVAFAFEIKTLEPQSVPLNILSPIEGTPLFGIPQISPEDIIKTAAIFRFIMPQTNIRYAGGRLNLGKLHDKGILSGINGLMIGDFLTTQGRSVQDDILMLESMGFNCNKPQKDG